MRDLVSDQVWMARVQRFLQDKMNAHFNQWKASNNWKPTNRKSSPYLCGYSQPEWAHELIAALGRGDESEAKAIMLQNL